MIFWADELPRLDLLDVAPDFHCLCNVFQTHFTVRKWKMETVRKWKKDICDPAFGKHIATF